MLVMCMSKISRIKSSLKRVKDPVLRERLLMVQATCELPLRDAAAKFGCTHGKIDFWKHRYEEKGIRGLYTKKRSGRPPKINREQSMHLHRMVRKHNVKSGWRTQGVRELIVKETGVKYSFRHTIRIVQSWGMAKVKPRPRYAFSKQEDREAFLKKTRRTWHANQRTGP